MKQYISFAGLSALVSVLGLFYKPLKLVAVPLNSEEDNNATTQLKAQKQQNRALSISSIDDQKSLVIKVKNQLRVITWLYILMSSRKFNSRLTVSHNLCFEYGLGQNWLSA